MSYTFNTLPTITMPEKANNPVIYELLSNYTYGAKWNVVFDSNNNCITMGNYTKTEYKDCEYVLNITDEGVYIEGSSYPALMHGFISFLEHIKYSDADDSFYIENCCIAENPLISFRCVHLCIFPETDLDFFKKYVRSCAIAKFSHIIFEFWGMLNFDCLKELSWPFAYSKEQIKQIVAEANALGVEIIPMFNHLGHASACREINGKHVVLDQNPKYEYMFTSYGWTWNFKRNDVYNLLSCVRNELIELCGEGDCFHLGCDEAYACGHDNNNAKDIAMYLNKISKELKEKGRKSIIWHDMLLSQTEFADYIASSNNDVSQILINNLDKEIIVADWQYFCHNELWKTSKKLKDNGFNVVCCPWDNNENITEALNTITSNNLYGIIHTTWDTLFKGFREMIFAGVMSYGTRKENFHDILRFYCASVARKAMPSMGEYEKSGWAKKMTAPDRAK